MPTVPPVQIPGRSPDPRVTTVEEPGGPAAPGAGFRGILMTAPEVVSLLTAAKDRPRVRVFHRIARSQWPKDACLELVLVPAGGGEEKRVPIGQREPSPVVPSPVPPRPIPPEVLEKLVVEGRMNFDLMPVLGVPPPPGSYKLRVELGPHRSLDHGIRINP